jgi:phospholipase/lecithinase/hemolysin
MSLDGVHPTLAVHREIANAIITAVNATYSTTLAPVP